ncbi:hypothetical protein BDV97DRAFT_10689 [Delphinella strobiligena]|nr:hypothetical protein BDV97DRAFT_10689 [Delphinella strobiligena]
MRSSLDLRLHSKLAHGWRCLGITALIVEHDDCKACHSLMVYSVSASSWCKMGECLRHAPAFQCVARGSLSAICRSMISFNFRLSRSQDTDFALRLCVVPRCGNSSAAYTRGCGGLSGNRLTLDDRLRCGPMAALTVKHRHMVERWGSLPMLLLSRGWTCRPTPVDGREHGTG